MSVSSWAPLGRKRLVEVALATLALFALLGPWLHPAVAFGIPFRAELLTLAGLGFLASRSPRPGKSSRGSRYRAWLFPAVMGGLFGVAAVGPLVAVPWILLPGLVLLWAGVGPPERRGRLGQLVMVAVLGASLAGTSVGALTAHGLRISPEAFEQRDLRFNRLLADIPLHDAWAIDLKAPASATLDDLTRAFRRRTALGVTPAVVALGIFRGAAGELLGWEDPRWTDPEGSFLDRLTKEEVGRSSTQPGTVLGIWRVLYALPREGLVETMNATVHVAVAVAIEDGPDTPRLFLGFRVREVNWATRFYMRLIDPARRFFIYPFLLKQFAHTWERGGWAPSNPTAVGESS